MNKRLFLATTAAVALATSAFAQSSPPTSTSNPPTSQHQQDSTSTTSPSSSPSTPSTSSSSQTNPSTNSAQTQSSSSNGQAASSQSSTSGTTTNTPQAPTSNNSANQAQTNQPENQTTTPSNQAQTNPPSNTNAQTQSANPPAAGTNQARSPIGTGSTNTAQQPNNQQNTAERSASTNVNAAVNINDQQRTQINTSISRLNVQPLTNVNFSLSVGAVVPHDVRLQPLPAEVAEILPQYRGYDFVLVKDEIVIVEPSSYKIVTVLPYSGRSTASAPARTEERKTKFSDRDRDVIRKHVKARPVERERRTTGSTVRSEIRTGERVPEDVEIEAFPEEVYRDAPTLREYRYINRDSHTYIVEPHERRIIEEID
ncbi:DUF1236 domain-containing protein [Bradyrhizobium sp. NAS96.2]|uniref:DUF1236 domain-containing protein n=1 Tax=Bradyrhizobium sp. NAS96.2 TaxID=1680160 RepID=UPI00093BC410|nr:DUF1236 domain-containing protein [Bradyrhizobium sp. NAS96.2]OKO79052.1 hypothetical protein AC628_12115 [Bradyrhizobium sp. NAS96.2]